MLNLILKNKHVLLYGLLLAVLLFFLKWLELRFLIFNHAMDVYIGCISILFTALGIWLALKLTRPKTETIILEKEVIVEKEVRVVQPNIVINETAIAELGLSKRELEVLELMAEGLSNQEIAERLFISLSTIKTHAARLFEKLDVKRRTQAVEKAKKTGLIA
ncbi:response regulator transcription factor [Ferruginibacter sp. HRS2-29]|uniref:response regulator transcription factor n=1 Tax=Ferruginibacter sp. HRS2-29 TaxID=2487334 RepID=UPI0020CF797C|nr:LuxR C-terminal-related transcriptional regulator [Ferruginibacter sp. HRS2-29]MCP9752300.1 winged helix-turn-helix transcriptional regulator [Ferruginibacter sp. HRS2-29]